MNEVEDDDDYWVAASPNGSKDPNSEIPLAVRVEDIGVVVPLPANTMERDGRNVPDALAGHLFPENRADGATGLKTYALLDAAKISDLPEILSTSDMNHGCLYRGKAFEELGVVGPWLVQIGAEDAFTHRLFMDTVDQPDPFHLWKTDWGVFVVSPDGLEDLIAHFRKFTIVNDADGARFYLRFWEPVAWDAFVDTSPDEMALISTLLGKHRIIFRSTTSFVEGRFFLVENGQA